LGRNFIAPLRLLEASIKMALSRARVMHPYIADRLETLREISKRSWVRILGAIWLASGAWDLVLSEWIPEEYSKRLPRAYQVVAMSADMLSWQLWILAGAAIAVVAAVSHKRRLRQAVGNSHEKRQSKSIFVHPDLQILFEPNPPYEITEITKGQILSTVRIGLRAIGKTLSNCNVYVETVAPEPPLTGILPILLQGSEFTLRPDEDEPRYVAVASHWGHDNKWRFHLPIGGWQKPDFLDDITQRTIEIRIHATQLQKTALFKIWVDGEKRLHMEQLQA
jgi:hypothetical protein